MDPLSGLILLVQAWRAGDLDECEEHLDNYRSWRGRGGYCPVLPTRASVLATPSTRPAPGDGAPFDQQGCLDAHAPVWAYVEEHKLSLDADVIVDHIAKAMGAR